MLKLEVCALLLAPQVEYELHLSSEAGSTQGAAGNVSVHRAVYYSRQHGLCSWNWRSVAALAIVAGVAATLLYYSLCSKKYVNTDGIYAVCYRAQ